MIWLFVGLTLTLSSLRAATPPADDLAAVLQRQTQELLDAIVPGNKAVWDRYVGPQALYTTEDGTVQTRDEMVGQIQAMPAGVSGNIKVTDFKVVRHDSVAVTTYLSDEHENYHGHELHCQYRSTDTWLKTPDGWKLIGGQIIALRTDPPAVPLTKQQMEEYSGRYSLTPEITYEIHAKDGALEGQQNGRKAEVLKAEVADVLFVPGKTRYRKVFLRGADGHITGFAERREAWDLVWARVP
ncbi:MAG TPA: nuclear transport factor 2 family protein [Thermoanaerobaculia bacterium]|nr:nuclear transport factor 2 family protein [Thermoanaerobaculia bacterium]